MHEPQAKANLLSKTLCPGVGLELRLATHCPCKTREWHKFLGCGGDGFDVSSKPCAECGINTCDECRIHVTYQVFMQDDGLDNRRWWVGYFLTNPTAFAIHPSQGTDVSDSSWHLPADLSKPHHDQGRFHVPLHIPAMADPEPIDRILDMNLGKRHITPAGRTNVPYEGDNLVMFFQMVAQARKELVCPPCFDHHQAQGNYEPCSCTFRKRFLDRWLCVACYEKEAASDAEIMMRGVPDKEKTHIHSRPCRCDGTITCSDTYKVICNWCHGEVDIELAEADDEDEDEVTYTFSNTEDDEDNAADVPPNLSPHELRLADNKDGTASAFLDGQRFSGERLGYGLLSRHAIDSGKEMPCTCCTCPALACQHNHAHGEIDSDDEGDLEWEDMDEDEDEDEDDEEIDAGADADTDDMPDLEEQDEDGYDDMSDVESK